MYRVMLLVYLMTKTVWYKEDVFWNHGALALTAFFVCFLRDTLSSTFFQQQLMEPCYSILYLYCTIIYCNINNGCPDDALDIFCKPFAVNFRNRQLGIYFRVQHQKFKGERQQTIITFLVLIDYWPLLLHGAIALLSFIITILSYYVPALFLIGFGCGMYYNVFVC